MLFNSLAFAIFLPLVFAVYWAWAKTHKHRQNIVLLLASYFFYGFWDWRFLVLIFISTLTDYFVGHKVHQSSSKREKKLWLSVSLGVNLGILGFFKYFNFFADASIRLFQSLGMEADPITLNIILPVGISFYTFQTLSYTIDIYRGKLEPTRDVLSFFTFVSFFPQLMAGPIERAERLLPQFFVSRRFRAEDATEGLRLVLWGLFKKIVIADRLGWYVNEVFAEPTQASGIAVLLAVCAFAVQVYGDFSGYSDMAIGLARLFGVKLMTNFRTPFFSASIQEFWNRWHISLSTWFRDYVYIPMGGSRKGISRWALAIMTTFLISGLWHGANYNFVIWGFLLGLFYLTEAFIIRNIKLSWKLPRIISMSYVFLAFALPMILFRAETFEKSLLLINQLRTWDYFFPDLSVAYESMREGVLLLLALLFFLFMEIRIGKNNFHIAVHSLKRPYRWLIYYSILILILLLADLTESREFVYFQF